MPLIFQFDVWWPLTARAPPALNGLRRGALRAMGVCFFSANLKRHISLIAERTGHATGHRPCQSLVHWLQLQLSAPVSSDDELELGVLCVASVSKVLCCL